MRISEIRLVGFKRFTDLLIRELPRQARLVVMIGPNGCGKSSVFDALSVWHRVRGGQGWSHDSVYYGKEQGTVFEPLTNVKLVFHDVHERDLSPNRIQQAFHFRTAYRNDPDFTINSLSRQPLPYKPPQVERSIEDDRSVSRNYQRLASRSLDDLYSRRMDHLTVPQLRERLTGALQASLSAVFEDLYLESLGEPLGEGAFHFTKGTVRHFHYKNLSGGEKSAFDLLLDTLLMQEHFPEAIFCIDEPEAHMHTHLQARLLEELFSLVPEEGQLWIATHSLGMMLAARSLAERHRDQIVFLDFHDMEFDEPCLLEPASLHSVVWDRFLTLALDELRPQIAPDRVVLCEGDQAGRRARNLDATCYSRMLGIRHPGVAFISLGSCTEVEDDGNLTLKVLRQLLPSVGIVRLVDRDDKTEEEVEDCRKRGIVVLGRRHLEAYLFDDEILNKLCDLHGQSERRAEILHLKQEKLRESREGGKPHDDVKSAAGLIFVEVKRVLGLTRCGNTVEAFMRDTLAPLVTPDTQVYQELEHIVLQAAKG